VLKKAQLLSYLWAAAVERVFSCKFFHLVILYDKKFMDEFTMRKTKKEKMSLTGVMKYKLADSSY